MKKKSNFLFIFVVLLSLVSSTLSQNDTDTTDTTDTSDTSDTLETTETLFTTETTSNDDGGLSSGAIAGITVGVIVLVIASLGIYIYIGPGVNAVFPSRPTYKKMKTRF